MLLNLNCSYQSAINILCSLTPYIINLFFAQKHCFWTSEDRRYSFSYGGPGIVIIIMLNFQHQVGFFLYFIHLYFFCSLGCFWLGNMFSLYFIKDGIKHYSPTCCGFYLSSSGVVLDFLSEWIMSIML